MSEQSSVRPTSAVTSMEGCYSPPGRQWQVERDHGGGGQGRDGRFVALDLKKNPVFMVFPTPTLHLY